jgi:protein-S-isoprenylcysteine O-methyltransferase Ste14
MMHYFQSGNPVAAGAVITLWMALGVVMLTARRGASEKSTRRDRGSVVGIVLQSVAIGIVWFGPIHLDADWPFPRDVWIAGAPVALLALASWLLFLWAAATMGRNWSLVARMRADHKLVESGPFALMRHPIYVALFGLMIATAFAVGHPWNVLPATPIYVWGTLQRVAIEERLLRETFGAAYDDYARRVKRFIPGIW